MPQGKPRTRIPLTAPSRFQLAPRAVGSGGVGWRDNTLHVVLLATDVQAVSPFTPGAPIPEIVTGRPGEGRDIPIQFLRSGRADVNVRYDKIPISWDPDLEAQFPVFFEWENNLLPVEEQFEVWERHGYAGDYWVAPLNAATVPETLQALWGQDIYVFGLHDYGVGWDTQWTYEELLAQYDPDIDDWFYENEGTWDAPYFCAAIAFLTGAISDDGRAFTYSLFSETLAADVLRDIRMLNARKGDLPRIDVALLMDDTGSFGADEEVKAAFVTVVSTLLGEEWDMQVAVAKFSDYGFYNFPFAEDSDEARPYQLVVPLSSMSLFEGDNWLPVAQSRFEVPVANNGGHGFPTGTNGWETTFGDDWSLSLATPPPASIYEDHAVTWGEPEPWRHLPTPAGSALRAQRISANNQYIDIVAIPPPEHVSSVTPAGVPSSALFSLSPGPHALEFWVMSPDLPVTVDPIIILYSFDGSIWATHAGLDSGFILSATNEWQYARLTVNGLKHWAEAAQVKIQVGYPGAAPTDGAVYFDVASFGPYWQIEPLERAFFEDTTGGGGDGPETDWEGLYQLATGAGYDGNEDGDSTDSGPAGESGVAEAEEIDFDFDDAYWYAPSLSQGFGFSHPGVSGDVPAYGPGGGPVAARTATTVRSQTVDVRSRQLPFGAGR